MPLSRSSPKPPEPEFPVPRPDRPSHGVRVRVPWLEQRSSTGRRRRPGTSPQRAGHGNLPKTIEDSKFAPPQKSAVPQGLSDHKDDFSPKDEKDVGPVIPQQLEQKGATEGGNNLPEAPFVDLPDDIPEKYRPPSKVDMAIAASTNPRAGLPGAFAEGGRPVSHPNESPDAAATSAS